MEKAFIITENSELYKSFKKFVIMKKQQKEFIKDFFKNNNIETSEYYMTGDGFVNAPLDKYYQNTIKLYIIPTKNDLNKFNKVLCKPMKEKLQPFKKNSKIAKNFAQECIDKEVIVNLYSPRIADYFKSLQYGLYGYKSQRFIYKDKLYLKVSSEYLKDDDIPEGFKEIKLSIYYSILEECESKKEVK